ncbi:MAG: hypothetical protein ACI9TP_001133, partial [Candidatus Azotimanducaceae bacterium]
MFKLLQCSLLALIVLHGASTAQASEGKTSKDQTTDWTLNLYLENDLFSNTD